MGAFMAGGGSAELRAHMDEGRHWATDKERSIRTPESCPERRRAEWLSRRVPALSWTLMCVPHSQGSLSPICPLH